MKILKYLAALALVAAIVSLSGCSSVGDGSIDQRDHISHHNY